jgi:multiple sugar transport system permease protein/raffinose/stachyose/melibiose transport system permease protein
MKNDRFVALVLVPAIALLTLFVVVPIIGSFGISLFDYNPLRESNPFLGIDNYKRLLSDPVYKRAVQNTLFFVFVTVTINIALTLLLAQCIAGIRRKSLRNLILVAIFMPCVAPMANSAVVWSRSLFPPRAGLFNTIITAFGGTPVDWIGNASWLMPSLIIFSVWADIGYNTVLFTAGIDGIPKDFYEAADIDGAGPVIRFFKITMPLLGRTFSFVAAMTMISHFQMFAQFMIFARTGGAGNSGRVLTSYIYHIGFTAKDMGYASAISVTLFVIIMVFTVIQQRLNRVDWGY